MMAPTTIATVVASAQIIVEVELAVSNCVASEIIGALSGVGSVANVSIKQ